jgi:epoxyqueuosine reductase
VSAGHAAELRLTIEHSLRSGLINDAVYKQYAAFFDNMLTQDISWAQSIIAVAVPRPVLEVVFTINGGKRSTIIPPVYEYSIDETVAALIERELKPHGYQVSSAALPRKLLAAHSGLARYGKNNITYVEGIGSFHRLIAFCTDLPPVNDRWHEPEVLDECAGCNACTKKCPTGAIDPDRFQLQAEKCLTFYNESSEAFPSWIDESWHHCLVGCIKCQHHCPVNKDVRSWTDRFAEFTDDESALLLGGVALSEMPQSLIAKFWKTDLLDDSAALARNLRSVLAASG